MLTEIGKSTETNFITIYIKNVLINEKKEMTIDISKTIKDLKNEIEKLLGIKINNYLLLKRKTKRCVVELYNEQASLKEIQIHNYDTIFIREIHALGGGEEKSSGELFNMEINIKFIKINKNKIYIKSKKELSGLLKLCLLKEISNKIDSNILNNLSNDISWILRILKNGYIQIDDPKEGIVKVLKKMKGSNIINFSNYVDEIINFNLALDLINKLSNKEKEELENIKNYLVNYIEHISLFEKDFERAKKNSIFEYSIISLIIIENEKFEIFSNEREKCPNRVDRVLFHGTGIEAISSILTSEFLKSEKKCYQHGKGVYFTEDLDYCWYYGGEKSNRANKNRIPGIGEIFSLICSSIYYNKNGFRRVYDYTYTPKKNEINFAYAGSVFETLKEEVPPKNKFYGTEYVIYELEQICPFISAKLRRDEYCIIWRDNNFSNKPVYNNKFDSVFKSFLKERLKYIEQNAKFNIYPCETSEEALKLVERKKYNKIILISNVGTDMGGKAFISNARIIIGNDVIALFLAYNKNHLSWIKNYKNALFSNDASFYEDYLNCFFNNNGDTFRAINELREKIEKQYDIKFYFDSNFLNFPNFKDNGAFSDLRFNL